MSKTDAERVPAYHATDQTLTDDNKLYIPAAAQDRYDLGHGDVINLAAEAAGQDDDRTFLALNLIITSDLYVTVPDHTARVYGLDDVDTLHVEIEPTGRSVEVDNDG